MKPFYTNVSLKRSKLFYRGIDSRGDRVRTEAPFSPELFITAPDVKSDFKTLEGDSLEKISFDDDGRSSGIKKAYDYMRQFKDCSDFKIYGQTNYVSQFIQHHNNGEIEYDSSKICIATIDIETECENGFPDINTAIEEITCLTLYENITKTFWVFSNKKRDILDTSKFEKYKKSGENVVAIECRDEIEMLSSFMKKWSRDLNYPDILTGWNCNGFDVPYIMNRLYRVFSHDTSMVDSRMSPWGNVEPKEVRDDYGNTRITYLIAGINIVDYMELYKKFSPTKQNSYALSHISHVELGEKKLSYEEYDSMHLFYLEDYPKFVEYNLKDVWLINRLEEKLNLMDFAISLSYTAKINVADIYSPVRIIESLCYDYLHSHKIIMKAKTYDPPARAPYVGGFVKEPQKGMHDWVVSLDLASLYPSIIRQIGISPENLVPELENCNVNINSLLENRADLSYLKDHNVAVAANGHHFSKEKSGFIPDILERLSKKRRDAKNEMLEAENALQHCSESDKEDIQFKIARLNLKQLSIKVILNSFYGALGNQYFAFYDPRLASAITHQGQFVIRYIANEINKFMNTLLKTENHDYVIYSDTDSVYVAMRQIVNKYREKTGETDIQKTVDYIDKFCKERLEKWVEISYDRMAKRTNAVKNHMLMEREVIASRGIWKAKKMYALYVHDNEGVRYSEPKMKIMGIETQRSSTPEWCRNKLKDAIRIILTRSEVDIQSYISEIKEEYKTLPISDIAFPRGLNDMNKWISGDNVISGCPINVRAAHVHNLLIKTKNLGKKYREITPGNKIKFVYLRVPNPTYGNVIGFTNSLPSDFNLEEFVDRTLMFEKSFIKPLQNLLDVIGWESEKRHTLEQFIEWG